jgi:SulP family sulfate permease
MLEEVMMSLRGRGGDLYLMRVEESVVEFMQENGFYDRLGYDHFLPEEHAIFYLFHRVLDPPTCIYECAVRVFKECQNLPKQIFVSDMVFAADSISNLPCISAQELQQALINGRGPLVIDVRESREFSKSHITQAQSVPLSAILARPFDLPKDRDIVLVCRGGWRSQRVVILLQAQGYQNLRFLQGGMLAWEAARLKETVSHS